MKNQYSLVKYWCTVSLLSAAARTSVTAFASPAHQSEQLFLRRSGSASTRKYNSLGMSPFPFATTLSSSQLHMSSVPASLQLLSISTVTAIPRGGAISTLQTTLTTKFSQCAATPQSLFNATLLSLAVLIAAAKILQRSNVDHSLKKNTVKPPAIQNLQRRFLAVFWLLRCADWMQGPYFYEVYASKMIGGAQASMSLVSRLFLTGFASTALFGPSVGRAADQYGRKKATLAFCAIYALGALSTKSPLLQILLLGRMLSGIGTSLLFSAPESWLVGESQIVGQDPDGKYLGETFGLAYAGDSLVAILAGQMATTAASQRGPTGPFELSTVFLALGGLLAAWSWKENKAQTIDNEKPTIREAIQVIREDPKIMMVGGVQSLFEAAMYIFVLQWPPAIAAAVRRAFGATAATPYGTIFSCFMACCLLGSTLFGQLGKMTVPTENSTAAMLLVATVAMATATFLTGMNAPSLPGMIMAFFAFEACVGMYFPSIGTLRSKYVPDSHRSVIMNLFGIPLNVLVVGVFLSIQKLGLQGALSISSCALGLATVCMFRLKGKVALEAAATS
jgi:MFS family permease